MDAPPNGPEEGLLLPVGNKIRDKREVLLASVDMLAAANGIVELEVAGASMIPTLRPGDRVRVDVHLKNPRFGDVIVFGQGDSIVVHRCLGRATDRSKMPCLRARGDGRSELDSPLAAENVVGTACAFHRDGTWRSADRAGGRAYAAALGLHDLFWAAAAHAAKRMGGEGLSEAITRIDRFLIKVADSLLFRSLHPICATGEAERGQNPR